MSRKKSVSKPTLSQHALVIGVGAFRNPAFYSLPSIANDARVIANVLSSEHKSSDVIVLADEQATHRSVCAALRSIFTDATADDSVFVYLAGHGFPSGNDFYYATHDTCDEATAVSLSEVKFLFQQTRSQQVFVCLDVCHSGLVLAKGDIADEIGTLKRQFGDVADHGKDILVAFTETQPSLILPKFEHGLFTKALVQGLKGKAKSDQGKVTIRSLYNFLNDTFEKPDSYTDFPGKHVKRPDLFYFFVHGSSDESKTKALETSQVKEDESSWYVPDFFQEDTVAALRLQADWLNDHLGLGDRFLSQVLADTETSIESWRKGDTRLSSSKEDLFRQFWQVVLHLLSHYNFDYSQVKQLLDASIRRQTASPMLPPWAGSSLRAFMEERGAEAIQEVDRWVMSFRFGDPYSRN